MLSIFISQFRSAALDAAREGKDPFAYVQGMTDFVPRRFHAAIFAAANDENWFATIFAPDPESAKHVKFLTDVRNAILYLALFNVAMLDNKAGVAAAVSAKLFVAWASQSLRDDLRDGCDDAAWFNDIFGEHYDANKQWIDALRAALKAELNTAIVTAPPAGETKPAAAPAGKK